MLLYVSNCRKIHLFLSKRATRTKSILFIYIYDHFHFDDGNLAQLRPERHTVIYFMQKGQPICPHRVTINTI